jgi:hypothetical protein
LGLRAHDGELVAAELESLVAFDLKSEFPGENRKAPAIKNGHVVLGGLSAEQAEPRAEAVDDVVAEGRRGGDDEPAAGFDGLGDFLHEMLLVVNVLDDGEGEDNVEPPSTEFQGSLVEVALDEILIGVQDAQGLDVTFRVLRTGVGCDLIPVALEDVGGPAAEVEDLAADVWADGAEAQFAQDRRQNCHSDVPAKRQRKLDVVSLISGHPKPRRGAAVILEPETLLTSSGMDAASSGQTSRQ